MFEMHEYMVEKWNEAVSNDDEVYIIGDFSFGKGVETWELLNKLHGKLILIEGNHDHNYLDDKEFVDSIFDDIVSYLEVNDSSRNVILSHYPLLFYNSQFKMDKDNNPLTFMLYGHVHNTYDEYLINHYINESRKFDREHSKGKFTPCPTNLINTFCLFSNYQPLTLDEWLEIDKKRREYINELEVNNGGSIDYDTWSSINEIIVEKYKNSQQ